VDLNRGVGALYPGAMNTTSSVRTPATPSLQLAGLGRVLAGGLLGGALDLTFAFLYYGPSGATPIGIVQFIASGVLGQGSFQMGLESAALGAFVHFFISLCAAGIYYAASLRFSFLTRRWLMSAIGFGILVFLTMRLAVLPLSAVKSGHMTIGSIIGELCSHMFLFAIPIAYAASRAASRRAS
jgi:hypothetical protein